MTGDLRIIKNKVLRDLLLKGPNFREPKPINLYDCYKVIAAGIESCADHMADIMKVDPVEFISWSNMILSNNIPLKPKIKSKFSKEYL